jgi:hypothetical protein
VLRAIRKWFGKPHDLPAKPPEPNLTPEEDAVARDQQHEADEWRADDPPRGDAESQ